MAGRNIHYGGYTKQLLKPEEREMFRKFVEEVNAKRKFERDRFKLFFEGEGYGVMPAIKERIRSLVCYGETEVASGEEAKALLEAVTELSKKLPHIAWDVRDDGGLVYGTMRGGKVTPFAPSTYSAL